MLLTQGCPGRVPDRRQCVNASTAARSRLGACRQLPGSSSCNTARGSLAHALRRMLRRVVLAAGSKWRTRYALNKLASPCKSACANATRRGAARQPAASTANGPCCMPCILALHHRKHLTAPCCLCRMNPANFAKVVQRRNRELADRCQHHPPCATAGAACRVQGSKGSCQAAQQ